MPLVSRRCRSRGAATAGAVVGALLAVAVAVLVLCGGVGGWGVPAPTAVASAPDAVAVAVPVSVTSPADASASASASGDEREPGCRDRHRDGVGSAPAAPPRGGAAYELLPALYDAARAAAGSWGAECLVAKVAIDRRPPPLDPPTPIGLSVLRV